VFDPGNRWQYDGCRYVDNNIFVLLISGNYSLELYNPNTRTYADYPLYDIHIEVTDPNAKVIALSTSEEGKLLFMSQTAGEHIICLYSNASSWFSTAHMVCL
jgi:hypothetical protein